MKPEMMNGYGLLHCQHFGVVVEGMVIHLIRGGYQISTIHDFMCGEKLIHLYHHNPHIDLEGIETVSYSIITSNCEHFAIWIVDGVMRSRQIEVIEWLLTHDTSPPKDLALIPTMSLYI